MNEVDLQNNYPINDADLRDMIAQMKPDKHFFSGRIFLTKLLDAQGVSGVLNFLQRTDNLPEELDLDLHFTPAEQDVFRSVPVQFWSKRDFLRTLGWGIPGVVSMGYGAAGFAELVSRKLEGKPLHEETPGTSILAKTAEGIHAIAGPPAELIIGGALTQEAFDKWLEIKLEQTADAIEVLSNQLKGTKPQALCR